MGTPYQGVRPNRPVPPKGISPVQGRLTPRPSAVEAGRPGRERPANTGTKAPSRGREYTASRPRLARPDLGPHLVSRCFTPHPSEVEMGRPGRERPANTGTKAPSRGREYTASRPRLANPDLGVIHIAPKRN
jgi:hypothetical protein